MNTDLVRKFKRMFEEQKDRLVYSRTFINEEFNIKEEDFADELDLTASELETAMRMRLRNREALYIRKIDEALQRIAAGGFGECECCGGDIEARRLEARPTTTMCIECKEEQERTERLHIDSRRPKSLGSKIRFA
ncbi:MAG: hypothetical protein A2583_15610 [Bdellovibrionales bacterium RIFOXYD1_FULL_53_11]|nr:MAG: hypothetical protein A2583_15610 [Bdellovibrionales bacterium RIFOXYD1_FULL_53_11]